MNIEEAVAKLHKHIEMIDTDIASCEKLEQYEACAELKNIKKGIQYAIEDITACQ